MKNDWVYVRAVRVLTPKKLIALGKLQEIRKWSNGVAKIVNEMSRQTGIKVGMHPFGDYVYVMCRNDAETATVCDFLSDRLPDVGICTKFPSIEKYSYERIWGRMPDIDK